VANRLLQ